MSTGKNPNKNNNKMTTTNKDNYYAPPSEPVLLSKNKKPFSVPDNDVTVTKKIKLQVEFPTQPQASKPNDISMYFKQLMTVLFAVDKSLKLLKWDEYDDQNPIGKAIDISPTKEVISQYFSGMRVLANSKKIIGYVKLESEKPFWRTKSEPRVFDWLTKNKVYVRTTTLSQNRHSNIGWLLYSHPEYTNQRLATNDLRARMSTRKLEFEVVPHNITHITKDGVRIATRALKVRSNFDDKDRVMKELMDCLKKGWNDHRLNSVSNTGLFKLVPFGNATFNKDQTTQLIKMQNSFLHDVHAISVINIKYIDGVFRNKDTLANKKA